MCHFIIIEELRNEVEERNTEIIHSSEVFAQSQSGTIQELAEYKLVVRNLKAKLMENEHTIQQWKEYAKELENKLKF